MIAFSLEDSLHGVQGELVRANSMSANKDTAYWYGNEQIGLLKTKDEDFLLIVTT